MLYINIFIYTNVKRDLFSLISILLTKKRNFLDKFNNDNMVKLKLDIKLASTSSLSKPSFF